MATTVVGMFKYQEDAEAAIRELSRLGYDPKGMSLVMKDVREADRIHKNYGTKVAEGAASGAVVGGVALGLAGLLVGTGVLALPALGALFVGGPIAASLGLTGAAAATATGAVTGAVAGGLIGTLVSLGATPEVAKEYQEEIMGGGILLAVPARDSRTEEVHGVYDEYRATSVRDLEMPKKVEHRRDYDEHRLDDREDRRDDHHDRRHRHYGAM